MNNLFIPVTNHKFGVKAILILFIVNYDLFINVSAIGQPNLVIDTFSYKTPAQAQAVWINSSAGKTVLTCTNEPIPCQIMPFSFTANTSRGIWDKYTTLNLLAYQCLKVKIKGPASTSSLKNLTIHFASKSGVVMSTNITTSDSWQTYIIPFAHFYQENAGYFDWSNIIQIRISAWQAGTGSANFSIANMEALSSPNLIQNSGFEITNIDDLPDAWASGHWSLHTDFWLANTDHWRAHWGVDRAVRHSGTNSLRITPQGTDAELQLISMYQLLKAGQSYTLSAWMKSSAGNVLVNMGISNNGSNYLGKTFTINNSWQRYSFNMTPTVDTYLGLFQIQPTGNTTTWIDDVQFETGKAATAFQLSALDEKIDTKLVKRTIPNSRDYPYIADKSTSTTVSIDANRNLIVNNQNFIPFGLHWEQVPSITALKETAKAGFNAVSFQIGSTNTVANLLPVLDNAKSLGLKVMLVMERSITTAMLGNLMAGLKNHPAVIVWYVYDEPETIVDWQTANAHYAMAKLIDPNRPAIVDAIPSNLPTGDWASDILATDYYPIPIAPVVSLLPLANKLYSYALPAAKPLWFILQNTGYSYYLTREPTAPETEAMAYLAITSGVRGFFYFVGKPHSKDQWNEAKKLTQEIRSLTPALSAKDASSPAIANSSNIHTLTKNYLNADYIIAVNDSPTPISVTINVTNTSQKTAKVLFEDRFAPIINGRIVDLYQGYQRHVYIINH